MHVLLEKQGYNFRIIDKQKIKNKTKKKTTIRKCFKI